jgi:hypothetical protein
MLSKAVQEGSVIRCSQSACAPVYHPHDRPREHPERPSSMKQLLAATVSVVAYSLFTVLGGKNPALCITIPFVYYGIMRYKFLAMVKNRSEEPEKVMLKDKGMVTALIIWIVLYLGIERSGVELFR